MSAARLRVEDLAVRFGPVEALRSVSFALDAGERVAVAGPNGAGKSTLFQTLAGLRAASDGRVLRGDGGAPPRIAYLPQRPSVDWSFPLTVLDAVLLGLHPARKRSEARSAAHTALETVHLIDRRSAPIRTLSGGQQQRLLIARALAMRADILLMDEPLTGLDKPNQDGLFASLDRLSNAGVPVLVALHDLNLAAQRFPRALLLNRELIADGVPDSIFTTENLTRTFGSHLHVVRTDEGAVLVADSCCDGHPG